MRRLHQIPYEKRLTAVVTAGAIISGAAAIWTPVGVAVSLSTLTNLIWILGGCRGGKLELVHKGVELLSDIVWEPEDKRD